MDDVARVADRIVVIAEGNVFLDGTPAEVFADPDKLIARGLDVPKATAVAMRLREKGLPLKGSVCTHEQLMAALREVKAC